MVMTPDNKILASVSTCNHWIDDRICVGVLGFDTRRKNDLPTLYGTGPKLLRTIFTNATNSGRPIVILEFSSKARAWLFENMPQMHQREFPEGEIYYGPRLTPVTGDKPYKVEERRGMLGFGSKITVTPL